MSARVPRNVEEMPAARRAAMQVALEHAIKRAAQWDLPELTGQEARTRAVGWLTRDRALVVIERDLVQLAAHRRKRAPWGEMWAPDWWMDVVLPAAAGQTTASWWARRAPRPAIEWARLLDETGTRDTASEAEERESS